MSPPIDLNDPWLAALVARSNVPGSFKDLSGHLAAACQGLNGWTNAILEVSQTGLYKFADGSRLGYDLGLLVIFRFEIAFVRPKGVFSKRLDVARWEFNPIRSIAGEVNDFGDGTGDMAIQALGAGSTPLFRLGWGWWKRRPERLDAATERDRILGVLLRCQAKDFSAYS